MQINHFNSLLDGGAATAARRLHSELVRSGLDSRFYYSASQGMRDELDHSYAIARWRRQGWGQSVVDYLRFRSGRQELKKLTRRRPSGHEIFSTPQGGPHTPWPPVDRTNPSKDAADQRQIIQLHWIAKFLDYTSFFGSIDPDQPVVWTLHDMNALTGGCHFSDGCQRFQFGCGGCPQLPSNIQTSAPSTNPSGMDPSAMDPSAGDDAGNGRPNVQDISRRYFAEKQAALANVNLHIAAPSRWLLDAAKSSPMLSAARSFHHIPYGISTDDYYPMNRDEARARLGIDPGATVFCFGAMDVKSRRKGAHHMLRALSHIADLPNVEGLVFGSGKLPDSDQSMPKMHQVGPVRGLLAQRTIYSAADVFVLPSLEDNLPLTGLEAMACGTAVVGFDAGGIPDYVRPGSTGLLARTGDAEDLGQKLRSILSDPAQAIALGRGARRTIEREYRSRQEAAAYRSLYAELLGESSAPRSIAA
ncbi:glycosyltransferase [Rubripirellula lacrimiformis]|uniref:glycosyltransferase n=1 Tax=Rubripirellula lacrimiformis TaxID=1930273 RepID=UPI001C54D8D6|nr:glycosyltransferase [Rubripirellula lacrimiformis]